MHGVPADKIPYYKNPDETHCWQCSLGMALAYFDDKEYDISELADLTGKEEGMWTWTMRSFYEVGKIGFEMKGMGKFDCKKLDKDFEGYIREYYNEEEAEKVFKFTNIEKTKEENRIFVNSEYFEDRAPQSPTIEDTQKYIDEGYLVIQWVNGRAIDKKEEFSGHFVLVHGYDDNGFYIKNPDSETGYVENDLFNEASWMAKGKGSLSAIKPKKEAA